MQVGERIFRQIIMGGGGKKEAAALCALANDGSVWGFVAVPGKTGDAETGYPGKWIRLADCPQDGI